MELKDLKNAYSELEKKYKLPSFSALNADFEIEKISTESDILVRAVRKLMMDKVVGFLNFFERVTANPASLPRIYFQFIKTIDAEDKKSIEELYSVFGKLSLLSFEREIILDEKAEAELIKKIYSDWNSVKPALIKISKKMINPENNFSKKEKSYFG